MYIVGSVSVVAGPQPAVPVADMIARSVSFHGGIVACEVSASHLERGPGRRLFDMAIGIVLGNSKRLLIIRIAAK